MDNTKTPEFLKQSLAFGINLGLQRMQKLMELLGNPQDELKVVHVAGTNGKGSTVSFISSILAASGFKVGVFTSPYLERFSERMRIIDGAEGLNRLLADDSEGEIDGDSLEKYTKQVELATSEMVSLGFEHPTEFELVTAISFLWYSEEKTDICVLETGLGGRLDSTNIISKPELTVITAIGMDHMAVLGDTIDKIAGEKAGIFKLGCPIVAEDTNEMLISQPEREAVRTVLDSKASEAGQKINYASCGDIKTWYTEDARMKFSYSEDTCLGRVYELSIIGEHQVKNCVAAIKSARILSQKYPQITDETILEGVQKTRWKGRAEFLSFNPIIILDGGHNPQCAESLMQTLNASLKNEAKNSRIRFVIGAMKDKNIDSMLETIRDSGMNITDFYAVRVSNPRSFEPDELYKHIEHVYNSRVKITCYDDACEGVEAAFNSAIENGTPLIIGGSLYLVGEVRSRIRKLIAEGGIT